MRREVYEEHRWIAQSLYKAFVDAQRATYDDLQVTAAPKAMLPWLTVACRGGTRIDGRRLLAVRLRRATGRRSGLSRAITMSRDGRSDG